MGESDMVRMVAFLFIGAFLVLLGFVVAALVLRPTGGGPGPAVTTSPGTSPEIGPGPGSASLPPTATKGPGQESYGLIRVTVEDGGEPAENAVAVAKIGNQTWGQCTTDAFGQCTINNLPTSNAGTTYTVSVTLSGGGQKAAQTATLYADAKGFYTYTSPDPLPFP